MTAAGIKGCPKGKKSGRERNMIIVGSSRVRASPVVGFTVASEPMLDISRPIDIEDMDASSYVLPPRRRIRCIEAPRT